MDADEQRDMPLDEALFAHRMKKLRQDSNFTQEDLAERMRRNGIRAANQTTVSRLESGQRTPRLSEAGAIASIFHTTIEEMISTAGDAELITINAYALELGTAIATLRMEAQRVGALQRQVQLLQENIERDGYTTAFGERARDALARINAMTRPFLDADIHEIVQKGIDEAFSMPLEEINQIAHGDRSDKLSFSYEQTVDGRKRLTDIQLKKARGDVEHQETS